VRQAVWCGGEVGATIPYVTHTVLIVDDHQGFRERTRTLLESEGFEVIAEAADGAEALARADETGPDVVLLDVQLPDLDGFEVTRRLREGNPAPAIVLVSSRDASDYGEQIASCGARGFVPKGELSGEAVRALLR
jgi:DNA-binding NarL/FixJ family response regulator